MGVTRRLVAIFYADVAGYSRLTGADEEGTHRRVMAVLDRVTESITAAGGDADFDPFVLGQTGLRSAIPAWIVAELSTARTTLGNTARIASPA